MATQITREPFARATLMREPVLRQHSLECTWCGQRARFYYYWERDSAYSRKGNRVNLASADKPFCSIGCYRTYTN